MALDKRTHGRLGDDTSLFPHVARHPKTSCKGTGTILLEFSEDRNGRDSQAMLSNTSSHFTDEEVDVRAYDPNSLQMLQYDIINRRHPVPVLTLIHPPN